jgi:D-amino peptidase
MKIYILADMEGISGIRMIEQVKMDNPHYTEGCELMMQEINKAIEAAFDAGATEVVACDTHGGGGQISLTKMDPRAVYETPNAGVAMPALDETYDGLILLGHHARAGTLNGFLDHTMSSASWFEYRINGQALGEIGIEAALAGYFDVPVIVVTGDEAACQEAKSVLGIVETALVKWGVGRNRARCLSLSDAHERIRQAIHKALRNIPTFSPFKPSLPATIELTLYRSDMADELAGRSNVERVDARTIRRTVNSLSEVMQL